MARNGAPFRLSLAPGGLPHNCSFAGRSLGCGSVSFEKVRGADPELGMVFLDGTTIRAHHKAAGAAKKGDTEDASGIVRRLAAHVEALAPGSA